MGKIINVGIIGAGGIAAKMAETVNHVDEANLYGIAARDLKRAEEFAQTWGVEKAYGSYDEMLADPEVDLVYIALPHSHHFEWTMKSLDAGKHVLCEKAFSVNRKQAELMIEKAESKGLLLTEAIWTRYMPSRKVLRDIIDSGEIGEVQTIHANLGYKINAHERIIRPELAGGALLDLTVYPINFASMVMGDDIKSIKASCVMTDTGVDGQDNVMIEYNNGVMASLFTTIHALTDRRGMIAGTKGFIVVDNINNPSSIKIYNDDRRNVSLIREIDLPKQINGYEYEAVSACKAINEGKIECPEMPHSETIEIMRQLDEIRAQFGIVYPGIEGTEYK